MIDLIIFSRCKLTQFSLQKIAEATLEKNWISQQSITIHCCSLFSELMAVLRLKNNVICLFDIDGVTLPEMEIFFDSVKRHFEDAAILVLYTQADINNFLPHRQKNPKNMIEKRINLHDFQHRLLLSIIDKSRKKSPDDIDRLKMKQTDNATLTEREKAVLEFIMQGMNNKEISEKLGISDKTVSGHRKGIYNKYYVNNLAGLYYKISIMG